MEQLLLATVGLLVLFVAISLAPWICGILRLVVDRFMVYSANMAVAKIKTEIGRDFLPVMEQICIDLEKILCGENKE